MTWEVNERSESNASASDGKGAKRKRRQWTVKEKLEIIASFEKCKNKRQTANKENCTPAQLRKWIKEKDKLVNLHRSKKGKLLYSYLIRVCLSLSFRREKMSGGWWWEKVSVRRSRSSSFGVVHISPNQSSKYTPTSDRYSTRESDSSTSRERRSKNLEGIESFPTVSQLVSTLSQTPCPFLTTAKETNQGSDGRSSPPSLFILHVQSAVVPLVHQTWSHGGIHREGCLQHGRITLSSLR